MDAEVIFSKQLKQIEKEKRDKETKLKTQEKKACHCGPASRLWLILAFLSLPPQVDYFVRAQRSVELQQGLIEKQYEAQRLADTDFHEKQETEMVSIK